MKRSLATKHPPVDDEVAGDEVAGDDHHPPVDADEVASDDPEGDEGGGVFTRPDVPRFIGGQRVTRVKGRMRGGWSYHDRVAIRCGSPDHRNCNTSPSLMLQVCHIGIRAAELYLLAWLAQRDKPEAEHRSAVPTRCQQQVCLDLNGLP